MPIEEQKEKLKSFLLSDQNKGQYSYSEKWIKNHCNELYLDFLNWNFPIDFKFNQKLYHYLYDDRELKLGYCEECGKKCKFYDFKHGYATYCCKECMYGSENRNEKSKQTCLKRYGKEGVGRFGSEEHKSAIIKKFGVDNPMKSEEVKNKARQTCLEKYGVENYSQTKECKEKVKDTCIERYGGKGNASKELLEKQKQTNLEKYGVENYTQTEEYCKRSYKTKKKNHSFNSSTIEEEFTNWLTENNFNFESQYKSEKYPFNCDFYLTDYDLYVEIQGLWTHGKHPYNPDSEEDNLIVEKWKSKNTKFYDKAIEVWTKRDVKKRNIAKENNLNYIEIFSNDLNECVEQIKLRI